MLHSVIKIAEGYDPNELDRKVQEIIRLHREGRSKTKATPRPTSQSSGRKQFDFDNVTKQNFKKYHYMNDDELFEGSMRQPAIKAVRKFVNRIIPSKNLEEVNRQIDEQLRTSAHGNIGGTVFPTSQGKGVGINRNYYKGQQRGSQPRDKVRSIIAHEAWHNNVPVLGHSEILAHGYGGLRSKNPWSMKSETSVPNQLLHGLKTRPFRYAGEAGLATGLGLGAYQGAKALFGSSPQPAPPPVS